MANPKKRRKKRNPFARARRRRNASSKPRRRRNPMYVARKRSTRRRRRNPVSVVGRRPISLLTLGVSAAAGAIGTRALTNLVLKQKNAGLLGYGANIVVALGLGYLGGKIGGRYGEDVGLGMAIGGLGATAQRIWDDKVSGVLPAAAAVVATTSAAAGAPVPPKSLGDVSYSDDGLGRALLGEYVNASFPVDRVNGPYSGSGAAPALPASTGTVGKSHLSGAAW